MATYKKTITITHTPTTRNICIPSEVVKKMGIKDDKQIYIEYDYETKIMTVKKNED